MADLNQTLGDINADSRDLEASLTSITAAMSSLISSSSQIAANFGVQASSTQKTKDLADKLSSLSAKEIRDKKEVNKIQSLSNELTRKLRKDQIELLRLTQLKQNTSGAEARFLKDVIKQKVEEISASQEILNISNDTLSIAKELNDQTKYFDKAADFLSQIPLVGPTLAKPFKDISAALKNAKEDSNLLLVGFKAAAGSIATLSLGFFITQGLKASSQVTDLQKSLLLSKNEAYALRDGFIGVAAASGDAFITTDKLLASNAALSQQLGFSKRFSDDLNIGFTNLTKRIGLSEEAAGGLAKASIITGRSMKSIQEDAAGAVSSLSAQYGIQLNVRDVLERAGKSSSLLLANFKGNPVELAKAVAEMDALGTSLETTQKQANRLLDWQTSIQDQLEASLITGRNINLDKARELALNNDLEGVAKELVNQQMDYNTFGQMNAIQRASFAKSLGLETQELSDQLLKLEYQNRSRTGTLALMGEEALKRASALSAQDKFNAAIDKLSGLLGNVLDGPMGKLVDAMATFASSSLAVYGTLGLIAAMSFASVISSVITLAAALTEAAIAAGAAEAFISPWAVLGGLALTAAVAGGVMAAVGSAKSSPADDLMSGYGNRTLITPTGTYALNNNDTVIAGTNLFRGNDVYSGPQGAINMTPPEFDYGKLAQAMSNIKLTSISKPSEFAPFISKEQNKSLGVKI
jgi:hypothetical protein